MRNRAFLYRSLLPTVNERHGHEKPGEIQRFKHLACTILCRFVLYKIAAAAFPFHLAQWYLESNQKHNNMTCPGGKTLLCTSPCISHNEKDLKSYNT